MFIKKYLLTSCCLLALILAVAIRGVLSGSHNEESLNSILKDIIALIASMDVRVNAGEVKQQDQKSLIKDIGSKMDSFSNDAKDFRVKLEKLKNLKSSMGEMENLQNKLLSKWIRVADIEIIDNWTWFDWAKIERIQLIQKVKNKTEDHSKNVKTVIEVSKYLEPKLETLLHSTSVIKGLVHQLYNSSYNDKNENLLRRIAHNTRNIEEQLISLAPDPSDLRLLGAQSVGIIDTIQTLCVSFDMQLNTEKENLPEIVYAAKIEAFLNVAITNNERLFGKAQSVVAKIQKVQDFALAYTKMSGEVAFLK